MDISNLQYFCGIANKKDSLAPIKIYSSEEILLFDVLVKNNMIFFKDTKNGVVLRALGFLHLHRGKTWEEVEGILIGCGMSVTQAKAEIEKEKVLISLFNNINKFRNVFKNSPTNENTRFGDWMECSLADLKSTLMFRGKIKNCATYKAVLLRDESGIPASIFVYGTNFNFLGEINLGITCSNNLVQYDASIDRSIWNLPVQVLTQNAVIASQIRNCISEEAGIPVGFLVSCSSFPNFGSVSPPKTYWVAGDSETPVGIINYFDSSDSLMVYRLPNDVNESAYVGSSITMKSLKDRSRSFCTDAVTLCSRRGMSGPEEFANLLLNTLVINKKSKSDLILKYCERIGEDPSNVKRLLYKYAQSCCTFESLRGTIFVKDSRYFVSKRRGGATTPISNFLIYPTHKFRRGDNVIVRCESFIDGEMLNFFMDTGEFRSEKLFYKSFLKRCENGRVGIPVTTEKYFSFPIYSNFIRLVNEIDEVEAIYPGFSELGYVSSKWMVDPNGNITCGGGNKEFANYKDNCYGSINKNIDIYIKNTESLLSKLGSNKGFDKFIAIVMHIISCSHKQRNRSMSVNEDLMMFASDLMKLEVGADAVSPGQICISRQKQEGCSCLYLSENRSKHNDDIEFFARFATIKLSDFDTVLPYLISMYYKHGEIGAAELITGMSKSQIVEQIRSNKKRNGRSLEFFRFVSLMDHTGSVIRETSEGNTFVKIKLAMSIAKNNNFPVKKSEILKNLKSEGIKYKYPTRKFAKKECGMLVYASIDTLLQSQE